MKKFEYKIIDGTNEVWEVEAVETSRVISNSLNELGNDGWEICGMTTSPEHSVEIYLKREISEE